MTAAVIELRVGARVSLDGQVWSVQAWADGSCVVLAAGTALRHVSIGLLAQQAQLLDAEQDSNGDREPISVAWSSLSPAAQRRLEERASHVRALLLPAASPAELVTRYAAKAAELAVSVKTLKRWTAGYTADGVVGLADARTRGRYRSSVDRRWDQACLAGSGRGALPVTGHSAPAAYGAGEGPARFWLGEGPPFGSGPPAGCVRPTPSRAAG